MKIFKLVCILISSTVWSQVETVMDKGILLGETEINIYQQSFDIPERIIFLNVHEDEETSIETLHAYAKIDSIPFFYLKHQETRRITFLLKGKSYDFDPNRIFTKKGRKKTLKDGEGYSLKANKEVKKLANEIIERIPLMHTVVALHNNTDENYSIKSYLPGGGEAQNTAEIHVNPDMDPDDFIYTTDRAFYDAFKSRNINVILQDNKGYVNDGSLSVYCGKKDIPYVNIETQRGHFDEQMELTKTVLEVIRKG
mgnify:CR=1 FL=1